MNLGRLLLRGTVGGFFVGHGTQKLFGWFGGHGLSATGSAFESMGLRPGKVHATAAGVAEAAGGAGVLLGFATPLSASALIATMLTATHRVHLKNGPWVTNGGFEYNAVLIAAATMIAELGPGPVSIDAALGQRREGLLWGLAALGAGAAGAAAAYAFAESQAPAAASGDSSEMASIPNTPESTAGPTEAPLASSETSAQ